VTAGDEEMSAARGSISGTFERRYLVDLSVIGVSNAYFEQVAERYKPQMELVITG
jgi:hypothetical protein